MEEILSSIRRIIADEESGSEATSQRAGEAAAPADDADVLELTDVVAGPARLDQSGPALSPPGEPAPEAPVKRARPTAARTTSGLISPDVAAASSQAMARLTRAVVPEDRDAPSPAGGVTVEQLVRELMTPVVKDWLEKNLPAVVERVVEQEVKKLARRAELL